MLTYNVTYTLPSGRWQRSELRASSMLEAFEWAALVAGAALSQNECSCFFNWEDERIVITTACGNYVAAEVDEAC